MNQTIRRMADAVKLYSFTGSPYGTRVQMALNVKGVKYDFIEENLSNKSADLLRYNPINKQVPVLVHNGKPISESLVIVEYIDDAWSGAPIMPQDAYEKSQARFLAKFIDDKCIPAIFKVMGSHGHWQAIAEAHAQFQFLENELNAKGTKFFGGDNNVNLVDIAATFIAFWLTAGEQAVGINLLTKDKFPKLFQWRDDCVNFQPIKEALPPIGIIVAFYKRVFRK